MNYLQMLQLSCFASLVSLSRSTVVLARHSHSMYDDAAPVAVDADGACAGDSSGHSHCWRFGDRPLVDCRK